MSHEKYRRLRDLPSTSCADLIRKLEDYNKENKAATGLQLYEHLIYRVKAEDSMRDNGARAGTDATVSP